MAAYQGETFFYRESRDAIYHGEVSKSLQMEYNKIALDTPDLLAVLKQRGLQVSNDKEACEILSAISYFRLACYFRPMEIDRQTHRFRPDATLDQVLELYKFDTNLRDVVFVS